MQKKELKEAQDIHKTIDKIKEVNKDIVIDSKEGKGKEDKKEKLTNFDTLKTIDRYGSKCKHGKKIILWKGNIVSLLFKDKNSAIVNAANTAMHGG